MGGSAQFSFKITQVEGLAAYRVTELDMPQAFEILGGLRYNRQKQDIEAVFAVPGAQAGGFDENWVDPFVGVRVLSPFARRFWFNIRADAGGFGIGSEFVFNGIAGVGWQIIDWFGLALDYRYMGTNYANGTEGTEDYWAYKGSQHGPLLGLTFMF